MDAAAAGAGHFPDRSGFQPAGGRSARRLRPAAVLLLILAACSKLDPPKPREDYHARFLEMRWDGLKELDPKRLIEGLRKYVQASGPIYPVEDKRYWALHEYLYASLPDPALLEPLYGPRGMAEAIEDWVLRRDLVALAVTTSFYRRLLRDSDDPHTAGLWKAVAHAGTSFAHDPLYGDSHTKTGAEMGDLFMDPRLAACKESREAVGGEIEPLLAAWRKRVTEKASTTMFGIILRHLGAAGGDRLFLEWKEMSACERFNLLKLAADREGYSRATRLRMVDAILEGSMEVREAAVEALEKLGAPVENIEVAAPEEELRKDLEPLRRWAAETDP